MTESPGLDLGRPRGARALFRDAIVIYGRNFGLLLFMSLAVVAPIQLVVSGVGLEELTSAYRTDSPIERAVIPTLVSFLVATPLITAATIFALGSLAAGERPRAGRTLQAALDVFAPVFAAVALAAVGIALGLLAFVIPGIYVAVRWYFVTQAVAIDGARSTKALARSWDIVQDAFWRTFLIVLAANLVATAPAILILAPFTALAEAADREAVLLVGEILTEGLTTPFVALVSTLLFYDLKLRKESVPEVG